jgi:hypothetical protein
MSEKEPTMLAALFGAGSIPPASKASPPPPTIGDAYRAITKPATPEEQRTWLQQLLGWKPPAPKRSPFARLPETHLATLEEFQSWAALLQPAKREPAVVAIDLWTLPIALCEQLAGRSPPAVRTTILAHIAARAPRPFLAHRR